MCSSERGELTIRSWELEGLKSHTQLYLPPASAITYPNESNIGVHPLETIN